MKGFKTVEEQVAILRKRGMAVDDSADVILLRENYYAVVNGYKDPFLDREAMQASPGDLYLPGTKFEWLYALFLFDRDLRQLAFSYLIRVEAALKTATVYAFCSSHPNPAQYVDRSSFAGAKDMLVPKGFRGNRASLHSSNINRLMSTLNAKLVLKPSTRPFTSHYLRSYGEVPLWVLANDLTFGNMAHFYQLMKRGDQNEACKILSRSTERDASMRRITPHDVLRAYEVLSHFRNLCAHDERLYCASKDGDTFADMVRVLGTALPASEVEAMRADLDGLVRRHEGALRGISGSELRSMLGIVGEKAQEMAPGGLR